MNNLDYKHIADVRSSAILTGSYVAGNVVGATSSGVFKLDCSDYNHLKVVADFTKGSLTDCDIKIEFSHDGTTYFQETFAAVSGAESTETLGHRALAANGVYELNVYNLVARFIKISAIGNGTATGSLLAVDAILSVR